MAYQYEFDDSTVGDLRYSREDYEFLQKALNLLLAKLQGWNRVAQVNGALDLPYASEVEDIERMAEWSQERLADKAAQEIVVKGISVGSLRYHKAALIHAAWFHEKDTAEKVKETWPYGVVEASRGLVRRFHQLAEKISQPPSGILDELRPEYVMIKNNQNPEEDWDVFISHASEDKDAFARPLAEALRAHGLNVWYDEFTLTVGDSLRRSIDRGLARSRFGIVVLSPKFFAKEWPQKELDGLVALEMGGRKIILPVWHEVDAEGIRKYSPMLADRLVSRLVSRVS